MIFDEVHSVRPRMDDQRTNREGGSSLRRFRLSLRLALFLTALYAVVAAWIGVEHRAKRDQLRSDIREMEIDRRGLEHRLNEPQVQNLGFGPQLRKAIAETDKAIEAAKQNLNGNK